MTDTVTSTPDTKQEKPRFQLDSYRAIAALSVVIFHAYQFNRRPETGQWPLQGTYWHEVMLATDLFVSLFFVLSAFLLGAPYARSALGLSPPRGPRIFLLRRVVRIVPLYLIVVSVVWSTSNPRLPGDWRDLLLHVTFTHIYSQDKIFFTDGPAWSLAVEVHFYLLLAVCGALAQAVCRRLSSRRARLTVLLGGIAVLIAASETYKYVALNVWHAPKTNWPVWFGPMAKLDVFAFGLLLAVASAAGIQWRTRLQRWTIVAVGAAVITVGMLTRPPASQPDPFVHPVVAFGCALIISSTTLGTGPGPRWLRWRPLGLVGLVSYSLYLWHEPVLRLLDSLGAFPAKGSASSFLITAGLLVGVAVPVAYLSFTLLERTSMKMLAAFDSRGRPRDYYAGSAAGSPEMSGAR